MFAIEIQSTFSAAHALRLPSGTLEPSHRHNFHITLKITAQKLDPLETVLDFHPVQAALAAILEPWKNHNLNDLEPFKTTVNPSAERIAEHIGRQMQNALAALSGPDAHNRRVRLAEVRVTEARNCLALWSPD